MVIYQSDKDLPGLQIVTAVLCRHTDMISAVISFVLLLSYKSFRELDSALR